MNRKMRCSISGRNQILLKVVLYVMTVLFSISAVFAVEIEDYPLDIEIQAASTVVMFLLDDSGSMKYEVITSEGNGRYKDKIYLFGSNSSVVPRLEWKARWSGYNKLYYNPKNDYKPWPSSTTLDQRLANADRFSPLNNPAPLASSSAYAINTKLYSVKEKTSFPDGWFERDYYQGDNPEEWLEVINFEVKKKDEWQFVIESGAVSGTSTIATPVRFENLTNGEVKIIWPRDNLNQSNGAYNETGSWYNSSHYSYVYNKYCPHRYSMTSGDRAIYTANLSVGEYRISVIGNDYSSRDRDARLIFTNRLSDPPDLAEFNKYDINTSHYFLHYDANGNDHVDADQGEIYLVNIDWPGLEEDITRTYYKVETADDRVEDYELVQISRTEIPESIRPAEGNEAEDLQNFANWYSYYRSRSLTAKAAVAETINNVDNEMSIGLYSIHENTKSEALKVNIPNEDNTAIDNSNKLTLLAALYAGSDGGGTPLRQGLVDIAEYYKGNNENIGESPYNSEIEGGACQQVYTVVMTDGYWGDTSFSISFTDPDGNVLSGDLDGDGNTYCLSDVARYFFDYDLRTDLKNEVPTNACTSATHQRMVVYGVSFGVNGTLNPEDYQKCTLLDENKETPVWPHISKSSSTPAKIDDLWHAAANANGEFYSASNAQELSDALDKAFASIDAKEINGASVSVSSERVYGTNYLYEGSYLSSDWSGELEAHLLTTSKVVDNETGDVRYVVGITEEVAWSAAAGLAQVDPGDRKIFTFKAGSGTPFAWNNLTTTQKNYILGRNPLDLSALTSAQVETGKELVDYIRGGENDSYRDRGTITIGDDEYPKKLGDIVNSSPVVVDNLVYVGANDGMLHAFNAVNGKEEFAYIPNLVFENLSDIASLSYSHRFYVDQTPTYGRVYDDATNTYKKFIVGGLNKGGKGYYCLDITNAENLTSETELSGMVLWEFTDEKMGYSYSKPVLVKTYSTEHPYVVIFGNGYNSPDGYGYFYILDLLWDGSSSYKRIPVHVGDDNGISSIMATDVNNDRIADYLYAGDLKGNLWKLDIRSADIDEWRVAYGTEASPKPLITTKAGQPITTKPDITFHPTGLGYLVSFGTGKYLGSGDLGDMTEQGIYAVWDYGDDSDNNEYIGTTLSETFNDTGLVDGVSAIIRKNYKLSNQNCPPVGLMIQDGKSIPEWTTVSEDQDTNANQVYNALELPNPAKTIGWYLPLTTSYERIVQDPFIRSGFAVYTSFIPKASICNGGGVTDLKLLKVNSGYEVKDEDDDDPDPPDPPPPGPPPVVVVTPDGKEILIYNSNRPPEDLSETKFKNGIFFWQETFK